MLAKDFDFARFRDYRAKREEHARDFLHGRTNLVVQERGSGSGNYTIARTPQESLEMQLEDVTSTMNFESDYLPYLEPWFGVGVFANAFGCEYDWVEGQSPQTHYIVHSEEDAAKLTPPRIDDSPVMKLVLDAITYFLEETRGEIPICCTDTQSPLDTATLIWEVNSFFTAMYTAPELVHKVMGMITDLVIEFTKKQVEMAGETLSTPGHIMFSCPGGRGCSISDDNIVMLSPEQYGEFSVPHNSRIAEAFGGLAVHSCGNYERQLPALLETADLIVVDGAFLPVIDPNPNMNYELWRDALKGTGIILQPRLVGPHGWEDAFRRLYHPDLRLAPVIPGPAPGEPRDKNRRIIEQIVAEF